MYKEIKGDLISLALAGEFDVITHGCNCFCTMGAGIAPKMAEAFNCNKFIKEAPVYKGDINKLGTIDFKKFAYEMHTGELWVWDKILDLAPNKNPLWVINAYTQYHYGKNHTDGVSNPFDYEAFVLCMKKINHTFKGKHIGLPQIGAGLAGGDWEIIKQIIQKELKDCDVTVVIYNK